MLMKKISLKMTIIASIIVFILSMASTYAYLSYTVTNDVAIKGNIVNINATLNVELVSGANTDMVPMMDNALNNVINGVGGTDKCVDSKGNLSCQVYKITLTNQGSTLKNLKGTIELYATNGGVYNNLKWQELSTATSVKDGSSANGMAKSTLVSGLTLKTNETKTWYIGVWISEIDSDQRNTDKGKFGGTVSFDVSEDFISSKLKKNATLDTNISFSSISSDTNGKGIYIRSGTENDTYPIYYYRGAVDNNNVLFANFCWKIVRTTETGGIKIIYNGQPSNGTCNNTGSDSFIGTSAFNTSYNSPAYVGYMYGTVYSYSTKSMSSITDTYYYGNDVTYQNGTYTLSDTITSSSWSSIYNTSDGIYNHHYSCLSTSNTCSNVYYIYYTSSSYAYYITLKNGKKVEDALSEMLDYNTTDSTIKTYIDNWYNNNMTSYTSKLEDTVWCNDRSIGTLNGWNPDGGSSTGYLYFSGHNRAYNTYSPSLTCSRDIDKFTTSTSTGNGKLTNPVGLITVDEIMLAGGKNGTSNSSFYLYTGSNYWWAGSPNSFSYGNAIEFILSSGYLLYNYVNNSSAGVRPAVSLAPGTNVSGSGTVDDPYVVS
jgi:hypothetical protein